MAKKVPFVTKEQLENILSKKEASAQIEQVIQQQILIIPAFLQVYRAV